MLLPEWEFRLQGIRYHIPYLSEAREAPIYPGKLVPLGFSKISVVLSIASVGWERPKAIRIVVLLCRGLIR